MTQYRIVDFGLYRRGGNFAWAAQVFNDSKGLVLLRIGIRPTLEQAASEHNAAIRELGRQFPGARWDTSD